MNVKRSTTQTSEDSTNKELARQWKHFPWNKARSYVNRLQKRIAKAVKEGKHRLASRLQYVLTHSYYAKALAVKKVTENKGKRTAGVDGVRWKSSHERMRATISLTDKGYKAKPWRESISRNPIPTKSDRCPFRRSMTEQCRRYTLWLFNRGRKQRLT